MPSQVTNYKCPSCTGPLHFDSKSGQMACEYCGSVFTVQEIEALYERKNEQAENAFNAAQAAQEAQAAQTAQAGNDDVQDGMDVDWDLSSAGSAWGAEGEGLRAYNCPSCGAELICDATTAATSCPYCANPTIVPGQFSGTLMPDLIVPFKLDKEAAKAALREHFKGKKLLPRAFSSENHLDEVKGVYVPFWLFDADCEADMSFSATRARTWSDRTYHYTETRYYRLYRGGSVSFANVPVDGSLKMADELMESLEPFDTSAAVRFRKAYLSGYFADRYDVSAEDSVTRANERVRQSTIDAFSRTTGGYMGVTNTGSNIRLKNARAKYALLPVWILNTSWQGKNYQFAMNGQTGKFVGDLPTDKGAYWKYRLIYGGIAAAVIFGVQLLIGLM